MEPTPTWKLGTLFRSSDESVTAEAEQIYRDVSGVCPRMAGRCLDCHKRSPQKKNGADLKQHAPGSIKYGPKPVLK